MPVIQLGVLTDCVKYSARSKEIFDAFHICEELPSDLAGSDDGSHYWGKSRI